MGGRGGREGFGACEAVVPLVLEGERLTAAALGEQSQRSRGVYPKAISFVSAAAPNLTFAGVSTAWRRGRLSLCFFSTLLVIFMLARDLYRILFYFTFVVLGS